MIKLYNYLVKDGDAIAVGLSALLFIVFALSIYFGAQSGGYNLSELTDMQDKSQVNCFNVGLWIMIALTVIAIVLMILGVFWDLVRNFKNGSKTLIGFALFFVAFLVLYFTSSHDTGGRYAAYWSNPEFHINESISKFISAGLYSLGGLTLIAFALILFFEIRSFFR
ncbi:MAG: hypothetical protein IPL08_21685 [Saprospiraceae bacterium]|nr:hypothetical protein [Saprospiraceae bacterium]MBL0101284.1 hypothetical protein [Saprospiraceae bacterium]